jgi:hypothetical protein
MIRKVYEVDPMTCPKCGGVMKVVAFITDYSVAEKAKSYNLAKKQFGFTQLADDLFRSESYPAH